MAAYNKSLGISFNGNDGGMGWFCDPETASDIIRHYKIFGKWRVYWMIFKRTRTALKTLERLSDVSIYKLPVFILNPEIPE